MHVCMKKTVVAPRRAAPSIWSSAPPPPVERLGNCVEWMGGLSLVLHVIMPPFPLRLGP